MGTREALWFVVVRPDNGYPVLVYVEKERAEMVAKANGYQVVPVKRCKDES